MFWNHIYMKIILIPDDTVGHELIIPLDALAKKNL